MMETKIPIKNFEVFEPSAPDNNEDESVESGRDDTTPSGVITKMEASLKASSMAILELRDHIVKNNLPPGYGVALPRSIDGYDNSSAGVIRPDPVRNSRSYGSFDHVKASSKSRWTKSRELKRPAIKTESGSWLIYVTQKQVWSPK